MFRKFFAHEFKCSYLMPLIASGAYALSLLFAFLFILVIPNLWLGKLFLLLLNCGTFGLGVVLVIMVIKTFVQRLFFQNGYLTLTLPVKTKHILISKLLVCFIWSSIILILIRIFMLYEPAFDLKMSTDSPTIYEYLSLLWKTTFTGPYLIVTIIDTIKMLLMVLVVLIFFLFSGAFNHSGHHKVLSVFITIGIAIFVFISIFAIDIIPVSIYYNSDTSKFLVMSTESIYKYEKATGMYDITEVFNFSTFFWLILYIIVGYVVSLGITKNRLDM